MTERERLAKLIAECIAIRECSFSEDKRPTCEEVADYMLAHGVIVPPCEVGDTVFCEVDGFEVPLRGRVRNITMFDTGYSFTIAIPGYYARIYTDKDFGRTVFFGLEEAEAALEERRKA